MNEIKQPQSNAESSGNSWLSKHRVLGVIFLVVILVAATAWAVIYNKNYQISHEMPEVTNSQVHAVAPNATADWKTYTNSQYGFKLQYPNDFVITENANEEAFTITNPSGHINMVICHCSLDDVKKTTNQDDFITVFQPSSPTTLDGKMASESIIGTSKCKTYEVASNVADSRTLQLDFTSCDNNKNPLAENKLLINQILSTFKFIGSSSAVDTSNWKTYTGKGFTMLYPPMWTNDSGSFYPPGKTKNQNDGYVGDIIIDTFANPKKLDLKTYYNSLPNYGNGINYFKESGQQVSFPANFEAEKFIGVYGELPDDVISINKPGLIIEINDYGEQHSSDGIFDAMAKSIK